MFSSLASGTTNYDNVIVELDIKTGHVRFNYFSGVILELTLVRFRFCNP